MEQIVKNCTNIFDIKGMDTDSPFVTVEGYCTTYNSADLCGDIMKPGAFTASLKSFSPILLWQHDHSQPLGTTEFIDDDKGLYMIAKMPKKDSFVSNRVLPQLETRTVKSFSIGINYRRDWVTPISSGVEVNRANLQEVSLVTFPANPDALIGAISKSVKTEATLHIASVDTLWDSEKAIHNIRSFTGSLETPSSEYKKSFLWYDDKLPNDFTSYKFPFTDVVDGEIKAIPEALSIATGILNDAKTKSAGVNPDDLSHMRDIVSSYYAKMGRSDPFESKKWVTIDDVKNITNRRDYECILRELGCTKNASVYLANKLNLPAIATSEKDEEIKNTLEILHSINLSLT